MGCRVKVGVKKGRERELKWMKLCGREEVSEGGVRRVAYRVEVKDKCSERRKGKEIVGGEIG